MKCWARLLVIFATVTAGSFAAGTSAAPVLQLATQAADEFINNDVTQVASAEEHTCAIREGVLWCWGSSPRLGIGSTVRQAIPQRVSASALQPGFTNTNVTAVALGYGHSCALEGGVVWCWGYNNYSPNGFTQESPFGDGNTNNISRLQPVRIVDGDAGNTGVTALAAGSYQTCMVKGGTVYCWGINSNGQLGEGTVNNRLQPTKVSTSAEQPGFTNTDVTAIAMGSSHTCALESGSVYCWGLNSAGALGLGFTSHDEPLPTKVTLSATPGFSNTQVTHLAVGSQTCAVEQGVAYCWGLNVVRPTRLADGAEFVNGTVAHLRYGADCLVAWAGVAYCWGANSVDGYLGDGTYDNRPTPTRVTNSATVDGFVNQSITSMSGSGGTTCVLQQGVIYCWGANYHGQLGNLTGFINSSHYPAGSPFPVRVAGGVAAPGRPTVTAGDEQATVSWPAVGGVLEYTVTGSPAGTCTVAAPTTTCTIAGLSNDLSHTFTVTASVSGRTSAASLASLPVTPGTTPVIGVPPSPPSLPRLVTDVISGLPVATPVTLSQRTFAPGVPVVYLATRRNLIDAMVAGPAAGASGGPVFTVGPGGLDGATLAEIRRLQPGRIVIMGGEQALPATLDTSVNSQLGLTPSRIEGTDRYSTAAQLSAANHSTRTQVVYIATGEVLVDAVSGGPAAGLERAPVLLVRPDAVPEVTRRELLRLRPDRIVVLGQTDAVSDTVQDALRSFATTVERIGGADRYATAVAVAQQRFPDGADTVYLTTGHDATVANAAVVPVATARRGPVLFTRSNCLITEVRAELARLNPTRIVTLGLAVDDVLQVPDC